MFYQDREISSVYLELAMYFTLRLIKLTADRNLASCSYSERIHLSYIKFYVTNIDKELRFKPSEYK